MFNDKNAAIGVFDSGVGGLSFLEAAEARLTNENFIFYADTLNAPYGEKSPEWIQNRLREIFNEFIAQGVKAIVLACNTATSAAVQVLRQEFTDFPILGMEPAIQLAAKDGETKTVVLSTPLTAKGKNTLRLAENNEFRMETRIIGCPGLMELVENMSALTEEEVKAQLITYLHEKLDEILATGCNSVVLGCTHYIFLRPLLQELFPSLHIYDGNEGTLNNLCSILKERDMLTERKEKGRTTFICSDEQLDFAARARKYIKER